jgi:hypothetical protein
MGSSFFSLGLYNVIAFYNITGDSPRKSAVEEVAYPSQEKGSAERNLKTKCS